MELVVSFLIASLIMLFIIVIMFTIRGFKIKDLKEENNRLYNELGKRDNDISNLRYSLRIEKDKATKAEGCNQQIMKALTVDTEEAKKTLNTIKKSYKVSNKNKITLIRMLTKLILFYYSQFSIDKLKANQATVVDNVKVLLDYTDGTFNIQDMSDLDLIANAIFTLILYKPKS